MVKIYLSWIFWILALALLLPIAHFNHRLRDYLCDKISDADQWMDI